MSKLQGAKGLTYFETQSRSTAARATCAR